MNCPQCTEPVAADAWTVAPVYYKQTSFEEVLPHRMLYVHCEICGYFEIEQWATGWRTLRVTPVLKRKDCKRIEKKLPRRTVKFVA